MGTAGHCTRALAPRFRYERGRPGLHSGRGDADSPERGTGSPVQDRFAGVQDALRHEASCREFHPDQPTAAVEPSQPFLVFGAHANPSRRDRGAVHLNRFGRRLRLRIDLLLRDGRQHVEGGERALEKRSQHEVVMGHPVLQDHRRERGTVLADLLAPRCLDQCVEPVSRSFQRDGQRVGAFDPERPVALQDQRAALRQQGRDERGTVLHRHRPRGRRPLVVAFSARPDLELLRARLPAVHVQPKGAPVHALPQGLLRRGEGVSDGSDHARRSEDHGGAAKAGREG